MQTKSGRIFCNIVTTKTIRMRFFLLCCLLGLSYASFSQVAGLWEVTPVSVGNETPTPIAKWFDLQENGNLLSGNGGVINLRGSWKITDDKLIFSNPAGEADPAGPFQVAFQDKEMILSRKEEGMTVIVSLKSTDNLPLAPWDYLYGNWELKQVLNGDQDLTEDFGKSSLFIRWDHQFNARNWLGAAKQAGIWQIHGHRAQIRLLYFDETKKDEVWAIESIDEQKLVLTTINGPKDISRLVFER